MDDIELTMRLYMNHKQACQAIGRAGSNIKSLRDETGCKITITSKEHSNRVMTLSSKKSVAMKGTIIKKLECSHIFFVNYEKSSDAVFCKRKLMNFKLDLKYNFVNN